MRIGIMGATLEEVALICEALETPKIHSYANRDYHVGTWKGKEVIVVFSRWGKVAASSTVTTLIHRFNCDKIIFTGVAGALDPSLDIGDVVIGTKLYQHDMDARPFFQKHEIPLTGKSHFDSCPQLKKHAYEASLDFLGNQKKSVEGIICSGDQFIDDSRRDELLNPKENSPFAVEMEGAAVAQVCHEHGIPFVVIRTISDRADHGATVDFPTFLRETASKYSRAIVGHLLEKL